MAELSIILLVKNERSNVLAIVSELHVVTPKLSEDYEIVVIGACRSDGLQVAGKSHVKFFVQQSDGYANALRYGMHLCRGHWIAILDSDGSHPPSLLIKMWTERNNFDVISASRGLPLSRDQRSWPRRFSSKLVNRLYSALLFHSISDYTGSFRLWRSSLVKSIPTKANHFDIHPELIVVAALMGSNIVEIPYTYRNRLSGKSKAHIVKYAASYLLMLFRLLILRCSKVKWG
jgi:dolichol-phosphate mannosyltransferase